MEGSRHLKSFRDGVKSVIDAKNGEEMRSCGKVWAEKGRTGHMFHGITLSTVLRRDNKEQRRTSPGRLLHLFKRDMTIDWMDQGG